MTKIKYITKLFILLSILVLSNKSIAQTNLNLTDVDRLSFEYYNAQKWDELIKLGKDALSQDIEFYYLNYRLGIAYYSKKKYRKAIPLFEKVTKVTPDDAIAKEYLYYSYLLGARINDAINVLYSLEYLHRKKIEFHNTNSTFNGLGFEYKYYSFGDYTIDEAVSSDIKQKVRKSMNYFSADLLNYTDNNSIFYFNFSLISGDNTVYDKEYSSDVIDENMKQYQFYILWNKRVAKGLDLNVAFTYLRENLQWYDYQNSGGPGNGNPGQLIYDASTNNLVGFISLNKSIANFNLGLGSSISTINDEAQVQPFAEVKWYPFSNTSFYSVSTVFFQYNFNSYNDNFIFKQSLVAEFSPKFSINAFGLYGTVYNFVDNNGLSVYNNLDAVDYWYGMGINYRFNNTTQMYLNYRNDGQTNDYTDNEEIKNISYNVNSVLVGLRFNF